MPKQNYLCIQRGQPRQPGKGEAPSPAQMEEMYAKFNAWKEKFQDNIVDTHVAELRRKLESDPSNPSLIVTVRKAGYRIAK